MKQHKINKTSTLVKSQKRQKKRRRESLTDEDDDGDDDDVKVNEWQERYFEITSLLALCFEVK